MLPQDGRVVYLTLVALLIASLIVSRNGVARDQAPAEPVELSVDLFEWGIQLGMPSVPAGVPVRLVTTNKGQITHSLFVAGLNTQTALLAPGQRATLELIFAEPGVVRLFCPVGAGSHHQAGEEVSLLVTAAAESQAVPATPAPPPTPTPAPLTGPSADVDRVGLPEGYRERFRPFYVVDRADLGEVRAAYINATGARVREGQPYPYGTILVLEFYQAQLHPDGQVVLGPDGRFVRGDLIKIGVMRKEPGFGEKYGHDRTGEWEYVMYKPDGGYETPPQFSQACPQCHLALTDEQQDWVIQGELFFEQRRLEGSTGLSPPGAGNANALLRLILFGLAIGAPLIALAALAIGSLARRS